MKITTLQQLSLISLSAVALAASSLTAQAQTDPIQEPQGATEVFSTDSPEDGNPVSAPNPGTVTTSATDLQFQTPSSNPEPESQATEETTETTEDSDVAQGPFGVAQPTRAGQSYVGAGYNIGFGDSGLGDSAFAINGKIGLTNTISVRPAAILGDDVAFLIPVTYDFNVRQEDPFDTSFPFAPYAGGGVVVSTGDDENIGFVLTGGLDVPLNESFTANAGLNVGFIEEDTDVGLLLGVGYTFPNY